MAKKRASGCQSSKRLCVIQQVLKLLPYALLMAGRVSSETTECFPEIKKNMFVDPESWDNNVFNEEHANIKPTLKTGVIQATVGGIEEWKITQLLSDNDAVDNDPKIVYMTETQCEVQYGLRLLRQHASVLNNSGQKTAVDLDEETVSQLGWNEVDGNEIHGPAKIIVRTETTQSGATIKEYFLQINVEDKSAPVQGYSREYEYSLMFYTGENQTDYSRVKDHALKFIVQTYNASDWNAAFFKDCETYNFTPNFEFQTWNKIVAFQYQALVLCEILQEQYDSDDCADFKIEQMDLILSSYEDVPADSKNLLTEIQDLDTVAQIRFILTIAQRDSPKDQLEGIWRLVTSYYDMNEKKDQVICTIFNIWNKCSKFKGDYITTPVVNIPWSYAGADPGDIEGPSMDNIIDNLYSDSDQSYCELYNYDLKITQFRTDSQYQYLVKQEPELFKEQDWNIYEEKNTDDVKIEARLEINTYTLTAISEDILYIEIAYKLSEYSWSSPIGVFTYEFEIDNSCFVNGATKEIFQAELDDSESGNRHKYVRDGQYSIIKDDFIDLLDKEFIKLGRLGTQDNSCGGEIEPIVYGLRLKSIDSVKQNGRSFSLEIDNEKLEFLFLYNIDGSLAENPFAEDYTYPLWYDDIDGIQLKFNDDTPIGNYTYELFISMLFNWFNHNQSLLIQEYVFEVVCPRGQAGQECQQDSDAGDDAVEENYQEEDEEEADQESNEDENDQDEEDLDVKDLRKDESEEEAYEFVWDYKESDGESGRGSDKKSDPGDDAESDSGSDKKSGRGSDKKTGAGDDKKSDSGSNEESGPGDDKKSDSGSNEKSDDDQDDSNSEEYDEEEQQTLEDMILNNDKNLDEDDYDNIAPQNLINAIKELKEVKLDIDEIDATSIGNLFKNELKDLPSREQQDVLSKVMAARLANLRQKEKPVGFTKPAKPDIAFEPVEPTGSFSVLFNKGLAGLDVITQLEKEVKATGSISSEFADYEDQENDKNQNKADQERLRRRNLEATNGDDNFDLSRYMSFQLRRGGEDSANPIELNFEVFVDKMEGDKLYFKVKFENPTQVSNGSKKDIIVATVEDISFFCSADSEASIELGQKIKFTLPRMLPGENIEAILETTATSMTSSTNSLMAGQMILTLVLSVSLKQMWNLFNVMQILAYMRNFTPWPALTDSIVTQLIEAIYLTKITNAISDFGKTKFQVAQESEKDDFLREQGIEDTSLMKSLGIFFGSIAVILLVFLFYFMLRLLNARFKIIAKLQAIIYKKIFYSGPLRYIVVGYLKLVNQFASLICFGILNSVDKLQFTFYSLALVFLMLWPIWSTWFLLKNKNKLEQEKFLKQFGTIYQGIKVKSFSALCYNSVFAVRRFDIVMINIYFTENSPFTNADRTHYLHKILCYIFLQLFYLGYVHNVRPHEESIFNNIEFVNEYCMMALAYIMINFTNVVNVMDPLTNAPMSRHQDLDNILEYLAIAIILFMTIFNFGAMMKISLKKMSLKCKKKNIEKQLKLSITERQESLKKSAKMEKKNKKSKQKQKQKLQTIQEESSDEDKKQERSQGFRQGNDKKNADLSQISLNESMSSQKSKKKMSKAQKARTMNRFNRKKLSARTKEDGPHFFIPEYSGATNYFSSETNRVDNVNNFISLNMESPSSRVRMTNNERVFGMSDLEREYLKQTQQAIQIELAMPRRQKAQN